MPKQDFGLFFWVPMEIFKSCISLQKNLLQQIINVLEENMVRHAIELMTYYLRRKRNTIPRTLFVEVSKVQSNI
jgi:hypothetical protein